jgi:hypothetical protein
MADLKIPTQRQETPTLELDVCVDSRELVIAAPESH